MRLSSAKVSSHRRCYSGVTWLIEGSPQDLDAGMMAERTHFIGWSTVPGLNHFGDLVRAALAQFGICQVLRFLGNLVALEDNRSQPGDFPRGHQPDPSPRLIGLLQFAPESGHQFGVEKPVLQPIIEDRLTAAIKWINYFRYIIIRIMV